MKEAWLSTGDLDEAVALANSIGWKDVVSDWRVLGRCAAIRGVRDDDGALVATGARCDFGPVATIAKMIVRDDARRRGIATRLLRELVEPSRADVIALVATALGEPVYAREGFRRVGEIRVHVGAPTEALRPALAVAMVDRCTEAMLDLDREATGADRARMLVARAEVACRRVVLHADGALRGFALATAQGDGRIVGPVVARDVEAAASLVAACAEGASKIRIDLPESGAALSRWLEEAKIPRVDARAEMTLGGKPPLGRVELRFALAAQAYG